METRQITFTLPTTLIERAQQAGVLTDEQVARLLEAELIRRSAGERLRESLTKLRTASEPLSEDEVAALVAAEVKAHRTEKKSQ